MSETVKTEWRRSAACMGGDCVEVRLQPQLGVEIRDSKDPDGPVLRFTEQEWSAFAIGVRSGEFDTRVG